MRDQIRWLTEWYSDRSSVVAFSSKHTHTHTNHIYLNFHQLSCFSIHSFNIYRALFICHVSYKALGIYR